MSDLFTVFNLIGKSVKQRGPVETKCQVKLSRWDLKFLSICFRKQKFQSKFLLIVFWKNSFSSKYLEIKTQFLERVQGFQNANVIDQFWSLKAKKIQESASF